MPLAYIAAVPQNGCIPAGNERERLPLSWSSSKKSKDDLLVVRVRDSVIALGASLGRPPGRAKDLLLFAFKRQRKTKKNLNPSESARTKSSLFAAD